MKYSRAVDNVFVWSAKQLSSVRVWSAKHLLIMSVYEMQSSYQYCLWSISLYVTVWGSTAVVTAQQLVCTTVHIHARSPTPHSVGSTYQLAPPDLVKKMTLTVSCLCGCQWKMTQSARWAPSDIRVGPSFHQFATRSVSWLSCTVYSVRIASWPCWLAGCIVGTANLDPPVVCVTCHYSSDRVPWPIVTMYTSYLTFRHRASLI